MSVKKAKDGEVVSVLLFHTQHLTPEIAQDVATVRRILNLNPEALSFKVTYGPVAREDNEIALHTRSGFQVLAELASRASVPPEHVAEHRTPASQAAGAEGEFVLPPLVSIQSGNPPVGFVCPNQVS